MTSTARLDRSSGSAAQLLALSAEVAEEARGSLETELAGLDRERALELAEAVERAGRALDLLRLIAARAVDEAAPAPSRAAVLVDHSGTLGIDSGTGPAAEGGCAPAASGSPFLRARDLLRVRLRISGAEAARRLALAHRVLPRTTALGEALPAPMEHLGEVIGVVSGDAARHVVRAMRRVLPLVGPERAGEFEELLADTARELDADAIGVMADRVIALLDPDGPAPREVDLRQGAYLGATHDGLTTVRLVVDQSQRELLQTIFDTGTNPRAASSSGDGEVPPVGSSPASDPGGGAADLGGEGPDHREGTPDPGGEAPVSADDPMAAAADSEALRSDTRSRACRMLDALVAAASAALRVGDLPQLAGLPPQVIVTMQLGDLLAGLGRAPALHDPVERDPAEGHAHSGTSGGRSGRSSSAPIAPAGGVALLPHAGPVPISAVRRLACDADLIPVVLGTDGRILDVGRQHRLVPAWMRLALIARDHGCTFPGCTIPATWCEAHHIASWLDGGTTSTDNSLLLCAGHHHLVHATDWTITRTASGIRFRPPWSALPSLTSNVMHTGATARPTG